MTRTLMIGLALCGWATHGWARAPTPSDANARSRIQAVKLYQGSATIERELPLAVGATRAVFNCLPAGLDLASVQITAKKSIQVGDIKVRQQPREQLGDTCASPLNTQIEQLQDQLAQVTAQIEGIDAATEYFKGFGAPGNGARNTSPGDIASTATALRQATADALAQRQPLTRQQEQIERQLKPLLAERDRVGDDASQVSTVDVAVAAPDGGVLQLAHTVPGPGWQPAYRATLDSDKKQIRWQRLALVQQNTGEDWRNVQLTLATGQPGSATGGALPQPWRIGIQPEPPAQPASRMRQAAPAVMMQAEMAKSAPAPDGPMFDAQVDQGHYATQFVIPQPSSVPSQNEAIRLQLDQHLIDTQLLTRTAPALGETAWLVTTFELPDGIWPGGRVQLIRDGNLVGSTQLDANRMAQNGLPFGHDDRVRVRQAHPEQRTGKTGIIGGRQQRTDQRSYTVENRHRQTIALQVLDAAPVSDDERVRIESNWQPKPATTHWNGTSGLTAWQQDLPAGKTENFKAEHIISWPKDEQLNEH